jgi:hypothetical protein
VSKNGEPGIPKIGSLFSPKSTMELYKYSMLNTKNVSSITNNNKGKYDYE